jgi:hypothetical protein
MNSDSRSSGVWSGVLLIVVGLWLVMQVIVGDLAGRLLSWSSLYEGES